MSDKDSLVWVGHRDADFCWLFSHAFIFLLGATALEPSVSLVVFLVVVLLFWLIFAVVADMAKNRGHSPWPWWIKSVFWSPFGSMIVLWLFFDVVDDE